MGQQNEKVLFEGHQHTHNKRKHIFPHENNQKPLEICEIPGCKCPLPHPEFNTKVCSACQEVPPPFLKTKNKPKYIEESRVSSPLRQKLEQSPKRVQQMHEAESIPTRISYYNAWSLPIQKYHIKERAAYNSKQEIVESNRLITDHNQAKSENVDTFIQKVTQRIVKAVDAPKVEFDRRKQNMNLSD